MRKSARCTRANLAKSGPYQLRGSFLQLSKVAEVVAVARPTGTATRCRWSPHSPDIRGGATEAADTLTARGHVLVFGAAHVRERSQQANLAAAPVKRGRPPGGRRRAERKRARRRAPLVQVS